MSMLTIPASELAEYEELLLRSYSEIQSQELSIPSA